MRRLKLYSLATVLMALAAADGRAADIEMLKRDCDASRPQFELNTKKMQAQIAKLPEREQAPLIKFTEFFDITFYAACAVVDGAFARSQGQAAPTLGEDCERIRDIAREWPKLKAETSKRVPFPMHMLMGASIELSYSEAIRLCPEPKSALAPALDYAAPSNSVVSGV